MYGVAKVNGQPHILPCSAKIVDQLHFVKLRQFLNRLELDDHVITYQHIGKILSNKFAFVIHGNRYLLL